MKALIALAFALTACNATVHGSRLSNVPIDTGGIFLSTGGAPKAFRSIGFVQVRGYGVEIAGMADVGDSNLDGTIRGSLAAEAARMGGQGVINIEFEDENPSTELERAQRAMGTVSNLLSGRGPETKDRYVTVTGEVIQFLE